MKKPLVTVRRLMSRDAAIIVAALGFGGLALYVADEYLEHQEEQLRAQLTRAHSAGTTQVIVAKIDLQPGATINEDTVAVRAIPTEYVHGEALRPDKFDAVKGKHLDRRLEKGRALLVSYVGDGLNGFSDSIAAGHRALTLNVDEVSSINGLVRPGDKLDLIVTRRDAGNAAVRPLLYDVKVLATGQLTASSATETRPGPTMGLSYSTITLEVSPREAEQVILARETGQVTAMLRRRNSADTEVLPPLATETKRAVQAAAPPHAAARAPAGREVDYILGGRGDGMPEFLRVPVDMTAWAASGGTRPQLPPLSRRSAAPAASAASPVGTVPALPGVAPPFAVQVLPADSPHAETGTAK